MRTHRPHSSYLLAAAVALMLGAPSATLAQITDIASEPLSQPASNVKPNIMLILDDSGSMRQQYTPDYMGSLFGSAEELCFDSADGGSISSTLEDCEAGDPPMMSPEVNYQYYNPEIRYFPALNFDGSSKGDMNAAATANWTAVPTDNVTTAGNNTFRVNILEMNGNGSSETTSNLITGWPDRAWCSSTGANQNLPANYPGTCRLNSQYTYPNLIFGFGKDGGGNIKYINGAPYYYRLQPTEYCTDATLTNCTNSTTPTGIYTVPAPLRFCDSTSLANCQGKLTGSYTRPKYTGKVIGMGGPGTAAPATATITVLNPQADSFSGTIQNININGVNVIAAPILVAGPIVPNTAADQIRVAINGGGSGYTATRSNNVVTITAPAGCVPAVPQTCTVPNGYVVSVGSVGTPIMTASVSFNIVDAERGQNPSEQVSNIKVGIVEVLGASVVCETPLCSGNQTNRDINMAAAVAAQINANVGGHNFTATSSGNAVTITSPAGTGGELNGQPVTVSENGMSNITGKTMTGGQSSGDVETTAVNLSGGVDDNEGRSDLGKFVRVNIVPFQDPPANTLPSTYTKYGSRTDCAVGVCTYAEEMTNFANWYAYYRSRMQMAKTAIGRAFNNIDDSYRVGFITINPSGNIAGRFLANADFDATQKQAWYQKLYDQTDHGSTPLREALARVGRYYGNVTGGINSGMAASPIQVSCQPSYAILTTDGYWNGNAGQTLTGGSINNQDNVNAGYSTRTDGAYDGALAGSSDTLADVAMYYYKTDLRTDLNDNVPTTQKDNAAHQHMVTFTVGLGLAGLLNFDKNYEEQTTGDFVAIKQGTKDWPSPSSGTESTLDDLWHAAVNGRGVFFSARDPQQLAGGIAEALTSVQTRVGAGAAAATSNLQPVAGDNFAFTAEYQTVVWTGDLKARTIDLSTGIVASRELWSAQVLLDQRSHTERRLYTFDALDITSPATGNGNRLKAFCWPMAGGTGLYPGCAPGVEAELSATEMTNFDPTTLAQYLGWTTDLSGRDAAVSAQKLVDFLRGDTSNESTGGTTTTDLFRDRASLLGDIVNAQPAYVKGSPFEYNTGANVGKDPYYQEFKQTTDGTTGTRKGTVYIAANDGMMHALETDPDESPYYQTAGISTPATGDDVFTGTLNTSPTAGEGAERFAYIPSIVMPGMKALAESTALFVHKYYVDGSPVIGDVCFGHTAAVPCAALTNWRTIMVAGLNSGGRGYYALDITDPDNPKGLWEFMGGANAGANCGMTDAVAVGKFSDCNLGLTFSNPIIVKRKSDGRWVVIVTSGYNNVSPGDGQGYFYVLDAQTGEILQRKGTGVGSVAAPSGLGKLNAWVDNGSFDNTTLRVYAGDLNGNLWRFQLDPLAADYANATATNLVTLVDTGGTPQPITTKPELGLVQNFGVVFVGTGKLLGTSDSATTQLQTVYAIRDDLTSNPIALRTGDLVEQTLSLLPDPTTRTTTSNPVDFNINKGWYVDLIETGERVNVDPVLQLGTLVIPSNVPSSDACVAGGFGWINFFNFKTGGFIPSPEGAIASNKISASLVVGINVVKLPGGAVKTIVTTADNQQITQETPVSPPSISGQRVSWRELVVY